MWLIAVLFPFIFIASFGAQHIQTITLSKILDVKYQCIDQGCSASTIVYVSSLRNCQIACLTDTQCRTVTFYKSNNQCELFIDIPDQFGNWVGQVDAVSMTAVDDRRLSARKYKTQRPIVMRKCSTEKNSSFLKILSSYMILC